MRLDEGESEEAEVCCTGVLGLVLLLLWLEWLAMGMGLEEDLLLFLLFLEDFFCFDDDDVVFLLCD